MSQRRGLKRCLYVAGLVLGAALFAFQIITGFLSFGNYPITHNFAQAVLMSIAVMLCVVGMQIINWKVLLKSLQIDIRLADVAKGYTLSNLPKYIPGSVWGYLSRAQWLNQKHKIPYATTNTANLLEINVTLISAGMVLLLWQAVSSATWWIFFTALALPIIAYWVTQFFIRLFSTRGWLGLSSLLGAGKIKFQAYCMAVVISFLEWLLLGIAILLVLYGSKLAPGFLEEKVFYEQALWTSQIFTLSWLGGFFIILVPGGLGVREFILTGLLIASLGIPYEIATLNAIASRITYSLSELAWLGIGTILNLPRRTTLKG